MSIKKTSLLLVLYFSFSVLLSAQESKFLKVPDGEIHYRSFGKGQPILIINGGPGMNSEGFATLAEQISKEGYRCIIFDQRGNGKSKLTKVDTSTITMANMVADMEALRKHLKLKKWTLFGQSFGGLLATQYVDMHVSSIKRVIFWQRQTQLHFDKL